MSLFEAVRAAAQAETFADLAAGAVPLLKRAMGAPVMAMACFHETGARFVAGDEAECAPAQYFAHHFDEDPITIANRARNLRIFVSDRDIARRELESSAAYYDYYRPRRIGRVLGARLLGEVHYQPGAIILGLFRERAAPAFTAADQRALASALPALEAVARRSLRAEASLRQRRAMEAMLERAAPAPQLALDARGRVLWESAGARELLAGPLPDALVLAARRLASFAAARPGHASLEDLAFAVDSAGSKIELRVERDGDREPFVIADLGACAATARAQRLAARHGLTRAETAVLEALGSGLSNAEVGRLLFISVPTVKTHVHRLLSKLGMRSRMRAAAMLRER